MDLGEQPAADRVGESPGDPAHSVEGAEPPLRGHFPFYGCPEEVDDLGHQHQRGRAVVSKGLEQHSRVTASHVEDVGADAHRVQDRSHLFEQMRERQHRHGTVLLLRDQVVRGIESADQVGVGQDDALRLAGGTGGEDDLRDGAASRPRPGVHLGLPIGRESAVRCPSQLVDDRGREVLQSGIGRVGRVAAGAENKVAGIGPGHDPFDRSGRHPQVQRHVGHACPHRPEVQGRHGGTRRCPYEQPIAGYEAERSQPPGDDPAAPVQLPVRPVLDRAVVAPHAEGEAVAIAAFSLVDDVEQAVQSVHRSNRSRIQTDNSPSADGRRTSRLGSRAHSRLAQVRAYGQASGRGCGRANERAPHARSRSDYRTRPVDRPRATLIRSPGLARVVIEWSSVGQAQESLPGLQEE